MSLFYTVAYGLGFAPWEAAVTHPPAARQIATLFEREEAGRRPPFGRALDLGCGRGHWSLVLAQRGWRVTGVELVPRAARAARGRMADAGLAVDIVEGDVTALGRAGIAPGFELFWDFGTLHGLERSQRQAAAREISALAADAAVLLMLAWAPGRRGPLPRGCSRADIEEAFDDWSVIAEEPFDVSGLPRPLRNVDPRVYRLRKRPGRPDAR